MTDQEAGLSRWAGGFGVIEHSRLTQTRVESLLTNLAGRGLCTPEEGYRLLAAAVRPFSSRMDSFSKPSSVNS